MKESKEMKSVVSAVVLANAALISTASGAVAGLDGVVGYEVHAFSGAGAPFLLADLEQMSFANGVGSASFASVAPSIVSGGDIWMEVNQVDATTRTLNVVVESDNPTNGFVVPGMTIDGGHVGYLGFSFGMDTFGAFPGAALLPFIDSDFDSILSNSGDAFDVDGNAFIGVGGEGLFTEDYGDGSFGGRIFYSSNDGADDLSGRGLSRFEATITYSVVPTPGTAALIGLGGLSACRRRR